MKARRIKYFINKLSQEYDKEIKIEFCCRNCSISFPGNNYELNDKISTYIAETWVKTHEQISNERTFLNFKQR